jgi:hypothetical protein
LLQAGSCREQDHLPPPSRHCRRCFAIAQVVLVADGQVTMGGTVVKPNVRKTRKIGESTIGGFAGALSGGGNTNSFHALPCCLLVSSAFNVSVCRRYCRRIYAV